MRGKKKRTFIRTMLLTICMTIIFGLSALAQERKECREAVNDDDIIKMYIAGEADAEDAKYQIGNVEADSLSSYPVEEDTFPMRTLIMLDNSLSIPSANREQIKALMDGIIDSHGNKEVFRLATFAGETAYLSDTYSDDYTALKNVLNSITYNDQETYLTDVLYGVLEDLEKENYMGYTRIVIISDGVDNNPEGITRDELYAKLNERKYPVYTVGVKTKSNEEQLKNMFVLSRTTNSSYWTLEGDVQQMILADLSADHEMTVIQSDIPEKAKTGGRQSSRLVLKDGQEIIFDVDMPFGQEVKETREDVKKETEAVKTVEPEPETSKRKVPIWIIIAGGVFGLILVIVILILTTRKKHDEILEPVVQKPEAEDENTYIVQQDSSVSNRDGQIGVLPGNFRRTSYRLTLTDCMDPSKTFQCELINEVRIGRGSENDIRIDYDKAVSGKHCMISNKNGRFFLKDLGSSNKTFVNGEEIYIEKEIFSGNKIKLGRPELTLKIEQINSSYPYI